MHPHAAVLDSIERASADLLDAAGELVRFPWTETRSELIDAVLALTAKLAELKLLHAGESALPANVIQFPRGDAA